MEKLKALLGAGSTQLFGLPEDFVWALVSTLFAGFVLGKLASGWGDGPFKWCAAGFLVFCALFDSWRLYRLHVKGQHAVAQ